MTKYTLKDLKFWYPPFNMGIPFNSIDLGAGKIFGYDYTFKLVIDEAEFLLPNGDHMPIVGTKLYDTKDKKEIPYKMFSYHSDSIFIQMDLPYCTGFQTVTLLTDTVQIMGESYSPND